MAVTYNIEFTRKLIVALYTMSTTLLRDAGFPSSSCYAVKKQFPELNNVPIDSFPEYTDARNWDYDHTPNDLADLLNKGMQWRTTTEGGDYWDTIYRNLTKAGSSWDSLGGSVNTQPYDKAKDKERCW